MADSYSVNSPRRTLSISKRATVSFTYPEDKLPGFAVSEEHGPKPSEVYGFLGSISTVVATVIFLGCSYIPEPWLHSIAITYYPSRYWALVVPFYAMVTVVLAMVLYLGLNLMATSPSTSLNTIFGQKRKGKLSMYEQMWEQDDHNLVSRATVGEIQRWFQP